ncbi:Acg family FMN-binding oxidoreductase [Nocardia sp. NPDC057353]|uniref:Acg family FMN-binding oxidoreductase n=1 Tax=Nocardia sp. NPDC057353 TaxID=3346104 RepID=UPI003634FF49
MAAHETLPRPADDDIRAALRSANRAPSVHNTQPWRWELEAAVLHLAADPERGLAVADPNGRQLTISCGAVLHHARTVFGAHGYRTDLARLPDPARRERLATLRFRPWPAPPDGVLRRAAAIEGRRTDRRPLLPPPRWPDLLHRLRMLASPHFVEVDALDGAAGPRLAAASARVGALHEADPGYRDELHWWTGHLDDIGVPAAALASGADAAAVPVGRTFAGAGTGGTRGHRDAAELIVLSSAADGPEQWLRTGEALSAILLECAASGAACCTLTHLTESSTVRTLLTGLLRGPGVPQVLVRVGTAPAAERAERTRRLPVDEVLTILR